ncbi:MAG TPA: hypothetical protein VJB70_03385 [Candidatus Paceibacterota bacterium]
MASWASQRRMTYLALVVGVLLLVVSVPLFLYFNKPETCFDGLQNGNELGIDCGGACAKLCESQVSGLLVHWSRFAKARDGAYDVAAFVQNPNAMGGAENVSYIFKLYDKDNLLIAERRGKTYINPNEQFALFEGAIETGARIPARAFFEFIEVPRWVDISFRKPDLFVTKKQLVMNGVKPEVRATLENRSLSDFEDIILTSFLVDDNENVVGISKTELGLVKQSSARDVTFLFPEPLAKTPARVDVFFRVNLVSAQQ